MYRFLLLLFLVSSAAAGDAVDFGDSLFITGPAAETDSDSWTMFVWVDTANDSGIPLHVQGNGADGEWSHAASLRILYEELSFRTEVRADSGGVPSVQNTVACASGRHFFTMTSLGGSLSAYLDGVLLGSWDGLQGATFNKRFQVFEAGPTLAWGFDDRAWTPSEVTTAAGGYLPTGIAAVFHAGWDLGQTNIVDDSDWPLGGVYALDAAELDLLPYAEYGDGVLSLIDEPFGLPNPDDPDGSGGSGGSGGGPPDPEEQSLCELPAGYFCEPPTIALGPDGDGACVITAYTIKAVDSDGDGFVGPGGFHLAEITEVLGDSGGPGLYVGATWSMNLPDQYPAPVYLVGTIRVTSGQDVKACEICGGDFCNPCWDLGDADGDGIRNGDDDDDDNDGIPDAEDADSGCGTHPVCAAGGDADGDGRRNDAENGDVDGDGIPDVDDATPYGPACGSALVGGCRPQDDFDGDGVLNSASLDNDGDGIPDECDHTPFGDGAGCSVANPCHDDGDANGDGWKNGCEVNGIIDDDGDGTPNSADPTPRGRDCADCDALWEDSRISVFFRAEDEDDDDEDDETGRIQCVDRVNKPYEGSVFDDVLWPNPDDPDDLRGKFSHEAECDWDDDGCLNKDDPYPCDPDIDCSICAFEFDRHVRRVQRAWATWFTHDDEFLLDEDTDYDGQPDTARPLFNGPESSSYLRSFVYEFDYYNNGAPVTVWYKAVPDGTGFSSLPDTVFFGSPSDMVPAFSLVRDFWSWVRAGLLVFIGFNMLLTVIGDLSRGKDIAS